MLSVIGFVVLIFLETMQPLGQIKKFETEAECWAWHEQNAEKLNAEFKTKPYRALVAECVDMGEEV